MTVSGAFRVDELSTYLQHFLDDVPAGDWSAKTRYDSRGALPSSPMGGLSLLLSWRTVVI